MAKIKDLDYELLANTIGVDLNNPRHRYNVELESDGFTKVDLPEGFNDIDLAMRIMKFWEKDSVGITFRRIDNSIYVWDESTLQDAIWAEQAS